MWHFMTKHQPTDLFLYRLLSDGSDFDGPLRGFQVGGEKTHYCLLMLIETSSPMLGSVITNI